MSLILVHSPKGGVGSTTVAANLALALARAGVDVAAVDLTGQDALGLHLGNRPDPAGHRGARTEDQTVVIGGVHLLSVGQRRFAERDPVEILARTIDTDLVAVVDIAAGDAEALEQLLPKSALHLCVLTPDPGSIALLPRIMQQATDRTRIVLNQIDDRFRLRRDATGFIESIFGDLLIASIRRDEAAQEALAMIEPLGTHAPTSAALADIEDLARKVAPHFVRTADAPVASVPSPAVRDVA